MAANQPRRLEVPKGKNEQIYLKKKVLKDFNKNLEPLRLGGHLATKSRKIKTMIKYIPSEREELITKKIVDAAYNVHKNLGPGLLEKIYEVCFCHELKKRELKYQRQVDIPIKYDNIIFDEGLRLDVLVEDLIICELKAVNEMNPVWEAQILSHMKLTNKHLGFLINFNVPIIKKGIKRFII